MTSPTRRELRLASRTSQVRHPWRATVRTAFAVVPGIASAAPFVYEAIAQQSPETATGGAAVALGVSSAITRVLALPQVEAFLRSSRFTSWLAADTGQATA